MNASDECCTPVLFLTAQCQGPVASFLKGLDMSRGRKTSLTVCLTPADRKRLLVWQRSTSISAGRARRGRIILLLADKVSISDIAITVGISRRFVYKWVRRFLAQGIEGLADKPGRGFQPGRRLPTQPLHEEGDTYNNAHAQGA